MLRNIYITICKMNNHSSSSMDEAGAPQTSALGQPRGNGGGVQDEANTCTHYGRFMLVYGKNTTILLSNYPLIKIN